MAIANLTSSKGRGEGRTRLGLQHLIALFRSICLVGLLAAMSTQAFAMQPCPAEFGPKHPAVNALGWLVFASGGVIGASLVYFIVQKTRHATLFKRIGLIALGLVGMLLTTAGGLVLAVVFFFLKC